jgi:hypothetical protein
MPGLLIFSTFTSSIVSLGSTHRCGSNAVSRCSRRFDATVSGATTDPESLSEISAYFRKHRGCSRFRSSTFVWPLFVSLSARMTKTSEASISERLHSKLNSRRGLSVRKRTNRKYAHSPPMMTAAEAIAFCNVPEISSAVFQSITQFPRRIY